MKSGQERSTGSNGVCLDLGNQEQLRRFKEALSLMEYCDIDVVCRIASKGDKKDLIRLLEETELPFNPDQIVVLNN